jgi:hypothetical protein
MEVEIDIEGESLYLHCQPKSYVSVLPKIETILDVWSFTQALYSRQNL